MDTQFVVPITSSCCGQVFISFTMSGVSFCLKSDLSASIHVLHNTNEWVDIKVSQLSSDQAIWVEGLVGVIALCSWATHFRAGIKSSLLSRDRCCRLRPLMTALHLMPFFTIQDPKPGSTCYLLSVVYRWYRIIIQHADIYNSYLCYKTMKKGECYS